MTPVILPPRLGVMLFMAFAALLTIGSPVNSSPAERGQRVNIQWLSVSDWHAQLDPLPLFLASTFLPYFNAYKT